MPMRIVPPPSPATPDNAAVPNPATAIQIVSRGTVLV
jgi:hypothetical protein